jgi:hypothetical protein
VVNISNLILLMMYYLRCIFNLYSCIIVVTIFYVTTIVRLFFMAVVENLLNLNMMELFPPR